MNRWGQAQGVSLALLREMNTPFFHPASQFPINAVLPQEQFDSPAILALISERWQKPLLPVVPSSIPGEENCCPWGVYVGVYEQQTAAPGVYILASLYSSLTSTTRCSPCPPFGMCPPQHQASVEGGPKDSPFQKRCILLPGLAIVACLPAWDSSITWSQSSFTWKLLLVPPSPVCWVVELSWGLSVVYCGNDRMRWGSHPCLPCPQGTSPCLK